MVLHEGANRLEIVAIDRVPEHLPTPGDTEFTVTVEAEGFYGSGSAWVEAERLNIFVEELQKLEANRSGVAELVSMSPDRFRLRVQVIGSAGHTLAEGRIANRQQTLEFRFAFDPDQLPALLAEFAAFATP